MLQRGADTQHRTVQYPQARLVEVALFSHTGQQIQCRRELLARGEGREPPIGRPPVHRLAPFDRERHQGDPPFGPAASVPTPGLHPRPPGPSGS